MEWGRGRFQATAPEEAGRSETQQGSCLDSIKAALVFHQNAVLQVSPMFSGRVSPLPPQPCQTSGLGSVLSEQQFSMLSKQDNPWEALSHWRSPGPSQRLMCFVRIGAQESNLQHAAGGWEVTL